MTHDEKEKKMKNDETDLKKTRKNDEKREKTMKNDEQERNNEN